MRSRKEKIIAGVSGGIGHYLDIDPLIIRLVFVFLTFSGVGPPIYVLLWVIMPLEPAYASNPASTPNSGVRQAKFDPMTGQALDPDQEVPIHNVHPSTSSVTPQTQRNWTLGTVLIILGSFWIISKIVPWIYPYIIPALLIGAGFLLLRRSHRGP